MSERDRKRLIKEFLDKIELELPFWLKNDEEELKDVLKELEEHIEDKAEAIEESGKTSFEATQIAIAQMGSPSQIVREYKRRGTPKFYITEELWPMYFQGLKYGLIAVGIIALVIISVGAIVTGLTGGQWLTYIFKGIWNSVFWVLVVAAGISVLFVWLSYEGYFPEDIKALFKPKDKRKSVTLPKTKIITPKIEEPKREYPKGLDKPSGLIAGGIFTWIVGILAIVQPFADLNALINPEFLNLLVVVGIFWIILGTLSIIHGMFVSWSYDANRAMYPLRAIIGLTTIPLIVVFLMKPEIFPIFWWSEGLIVLEIAAEFYWIYYLVFAFILIGVIAGAIHNIYRATQLDEAYFFEA